MILDEGAVRDTRMRVDRADPKDKDEQREFQEILEQFKRGIDENLDSEDYEAHYDLGIAFKEMGLLDEAIAEFQKALRSPDGRLRTSEALGICFYDKGQFGISETVLRRAVETVDGGDEAKIGLLYWLGRAAEAQGKEMDAITSYERALAVDIRFMDLSDRMHRLAADRQQVNPQTAPVSLADIQRPLRARLERVQQELRRVVEADFGLITEVNCHLFRMQGKLFRPTLLLLADEATGEPDPRATTLAAVVELIHLATLVHDDSVDHSVLRRGMPTINALFSHQISVIMGDYLYSRAVIELVGVGDLEPLRVLSRVTNEMTVGEMRQLLAHDPLQYSEEDYDLLIQSKTASLVSGACEVGALHATPEERLALRRFGEALGHGVPDRGRPARLRGRRQRHREADRIGSAGAQGHAAADRGAAADGRGDRRRVADLLKAPEPTDEQIHAVVESVAEAGGPRLRARARAPAGAAGRRRARPAAAVARAGRAPGQHRLRRGPPALMASGPHRPGFYLGVLVAGFVAGGALTALLRQTLPDSAARTFFTTTWTAQFGPVSADLLVISFTLGPIGLHVSLLSLIAVILAYLIARSLF